MRIRQVCFVSEFLSDIGLDIAYGATCDSFLPGLRIRNGGLVVDQAIASLGDLLHEAGHLAVVPGRFRALMSDDIDAGVEAMFRECDRLEFQPDDKTMVQAMQASECEAIAWSWAAGKHLGLSAEDIFPDGAFDGGSTDLRLQLSVGQHLGVNGLARTGMTDLPSRDHKGMKAFPQMRRWLQEH
jgi:hypothetical protein